MSLGLRLRTLAGYHHQSSSSVWDIGCDHGLLGLSFCENPLIKNIHLVDPSIDVINVLFKTIKDSYITIKDLIHVHHKKGQEVILSSECKTIFIAGMGGKEIHQILEHLIPQLTIQDRVVISPHRNILELREFLQTSELKLFEEVSIEENGQFYQVLCLVKDPTFSPVSPFGINVWKGESGETYRQYQLKVLRQHQDSRSRALVEYLNCLSY